MIVLLKFLFKGILIFFLSFLKMFVKVRRKPVMLQRRFLWGGMKMESMISLIKWDDVYKTKSKEVCGWGGGRC